ncbi:MAG: 1-acyl-sn-glycerol-3-phosphate acyltransferase [Clostridia bacterium]|nr:1-acyl-sn-glycerol-3-phosphate acyltransferase [Clostridia bacterium]
MLIWILILLLSIGTAAGLSFAFGPCETWSFVLRIPLLFFAAYVAWVILYALLFSFISLFIDKRKPVTKVHHGMRRFVAETMQFAMIVGRIRVHAEGLDRIDRTKPFLLVANHRSMIDPFIPLSLLKGTEIVYICKPEVKDMPVFGRYAHICGFPFIDRENNRAALKTILHAVDILKDEQTAVAIFPEGTRNKTDAPLLPLHAGSFSIAKRANVPIVVAASRNTEKALKQVIWHGTKVSFKVIDVLTPDRIADLSTQEIAARVAEAIEAEMKD